MGGNRFKAMVWVLQRSAEACLHFLEAKEVVLCQKLNRGSHKRSIRIIFAFVSWLGNGKFWYALMVVLLLWHQAEGVRPVAHMMIVGAIGTLCYLILKRVLVRERPYIAHDSVEGVVAPLDEYSFPSGHTLHAVCFSMVVVHYFPEWFWVVMPFTVLIALSRVILGLHYPTDVIAGAGLGALLAHVSFYFV